MAYWPDLTKGASFEELFAQLGDPEFREYNNIKGWGEYYKTLETKTEDGLRELGQQLKAANAARDVKRFKLIKDVRDQLCLWWTRKKLLEWSISGDEEDDDLWDFHDSGLADAVLDVASDERIYVQENEEEVVRDVLIHSCMYRDVLTTKERCLLKELFSPCVQLASCVSMRLLPYCAALATETPQKRQIFLGTDEQALPYALETEGTDA